MNHVLSRRDRKISALLIISILILSPPIFAQEMTAGSTGTHIVILVKGEDIYTDMGASMGIVPGSILEIYREIQHIVHPVTKALLGEMPVIIGTMYVTQVSDKYSVGRILNWATTGSVQQLDRVRLTQTKHTAVAPEKKKKSGSGKIWVFVPGVYQFKQGKYVKGGLLLSSAIGFAVGGTMFKLSSRSAHKDYLNLSAGATQAEFDRTFNSYKWRGFTGDVFLWTAGGIYFYNLLDGLLFTRAKPNRAFHMSPAGPDLHGLALTIVF